MSRKFLRIVLGIISLALPPVVAFLLLANASDVGAGAGGVFFGIIIYLYLIIAALWLTTYSVFRKLRVSKEVAAKSCLLKAAVFFVMVIVVYLMSVVSCASSDRCSFYNDSISFFETSSYSIFIGIPLLLLLGYFLVSWAFIKNRKVFGVLLIALFLVGGTIFVYPKRQVQVYEMEHQEAGVHLYFMEARSCLGTRQLMSQNFYEDESGLIIDRWTCFGAVVERHCFEMVYEERGTIPVVALRERNTVSCDEKDEYLKNVKSDSESTEKEPIPDPPSIGI